MANNAENVTYGKPRVGGAIFTAPINTALPESAISELSDAFKSLGFISEDGVANDQERENEEIVAWGGSTVLYTQTSKKDEFSYTLIESLNEDVLKEVYGATNVSGTIKAGLTIKANATPLEAHVVVIDMILKGNILKRIVVPNGTVTAVDEVEYKDDDAIGYATTLSCLPYNDDGDTHVEYIQSTEIEE